MKVFHKNFTRKERWVFAGAAILLAIAIAGSLLRGDWIVLLWKVTTAILFVVLWAFVYLVHEQQELIDQMLRDMEQQIDSLRLRRFAQLQRRLGIRNQGPINN